MKSDMFYAIADKILNANCDDNEKIVKHIGFRNDALARIGLIIHY